MRRGEGCEGSEHLSIKRNRAVVVGSPGEATPLRRDLVATHYAYGDRIRERTEADRRVADMLAAVTAERDGLKIAYRMQGVVLEEALRDRDEWAEKCRALSRNMEAMGRLLRMHDGPSTPTSSRTALHRARDSLYSPVES